MSAIAAVVVVVEEASFVKLAGRAVDLIAAVVAFAALLLAVGRKPASVVFEREADLVALEAASSVD